MAPRMGVAALVAAIVESSDDAIIARDLNGVILSWNAAAERLFGYSSEEAIHQPVTLIVPEDRLDEEAALRERMRTDGGVEHLETVRRRKDGRLVNISLTVAPIRTNEGLVIGALKIARDITLEKLAAGRLAEEIRIVETLNRVGAAVATALDHDEVVQAVTDAAAELTTAAIASFVTGPQAESAGPLTIYAIAGPSKRLFPGFPGSPDHPIVAGTLRATGVLRIADVATNPQLAGGFAAAAPDGPGIRSYMAVPVVKASGETLGVLVFGHPDPGVFTDRHELLARGMAGWTAVALENARLYEEAQQANRLKDEFLATLSHELRTPLNAIMGWAHILSSAAADERTRTRALDVIQRNARVQAQLIEDLLDVSRIVAGKLTLRHEDVDLTAVIAAAIDDIKPTAQAKGIHIDASVSAAASAVSGDAARLQQIVSNLLSNAVKFTPAGGRVDVRLGRDGGYALLSVSDTGRGIPAPFLAHVFDPFRQADSSPVRQQPGLGLGLGIVKHLTEAHGGTVSASSPGEEHGATFEVRLPLRDAREVIPRLPDEVGAVLSPGQLSGIRVLIVDDDADSADMLAFTLARYGADVTTVSSASEAIDVAKSRPFQILLADIGMPDMSGFDLVKEIRALEADRRLTLLAAGAVTAYAGKRERSEVLAAGFDWHMAKPVDPERVAARVASAIASQHARLVTLAASPAGPPRGRA